MKKLYKVTCEPDVSSFSIKVEANSEEEAKELAEEMYSNGDIDFESDEIMCSHDSSEVDSCTAIKAEIVEESND